MSSPIVVALPPGGSSEDILALAVAMARLTEQPLVLGGVSLRVPIVPSSLGASVPDELVDPGPTDEALAADLQVIAETLPSDVTSTVDAVGAPNAALGIERLADRHTAGLIVLGASHRGVVSRVLDGDPDLGVLRHAPCPVLVAAAAPSARSAPATPQRIGVAWDRTDEADDALQLAADLARRAGAALSVIHVLIPEAPIFVPPADPKMGHELTHARGAEAEAEIRQAITDHGIDASTTVDIRQGHPEEQLVEASAWVDLLVVGSRRTGAWRRAISGSVSAHVIHHAHHPVLVVPTAASTPPAG